MNRLFILAFKGYQILISPLLGPRCRFYPTCSSYAITVLKKRSLVDALSLIIKRVSRCHPFNEGGIDFPPDGNKIKPIQK